MNIPTKTWLKDTGKKAARSYKLILKHSGTTRREWMHIGELGGDVKRSATRGSGILGSWREEFIPQVSPPILSAAIWLADFPAAAAMVPETQNHPTNIKGEWTKIAKDRIAQFVRIGRNDDNELAKELGVPLAQIGKWIEKERLKDAIKPTADRTMREDDVAEAFNGTLPEAHIGHLRHIKQLLEDHRVREAIVKIDGLLKSESDT